MGRRERKVIPRCRRWLRVFARTTGAAILMAAAAAQAQSWRPEKAVELLVGSGAGGSNDTVARTIQKIVQEQKLAPVTLNVVNKVGGNQTILRTYLNQHAGDAHYFDLGNPTLIVNHIMGISTQHFGDFSPVALLLNEYTAFTVKADSPVKNARDLAGLLKKDSDAWSVGVSNLGGSNHLTLSLFAKSAGVDPKRLKVVVFKSNTDGITAVLGGHLQMVSSSLTSVIGHVRTGTARVIALGSPRRMAGALADVPTLREQGTDIVVSNWRGIVGARGLSAAQIGYWEDVLSKVVATDEWRRNLEVQNWEGNFLRSAEFRKYLENDYNQTRAIMSDLGLAK